MQIGETGVAHFCALFRLQVYLDVAWTRSASSGRKGDARVRIRGRQLKILYMASVVSSEITFALARTAKRNEGVLFGP